MWVICSQRGAPTRNKREGATIVMWKKKHQIIISLDKKTVETKKQLVQRKIGENRVTSCKHRTRTARNDRSSCQEAIVALQHRRGYVSSAINRLRCLLDCRSIRSTGQNSTIICIPRQHLYAYLAIDSRSSPLKLPTTRMVKRKTHAHAHPPWGTE